MPPLSAILYLTVCDKYIMRQPSKSKVCIDCNTEKNRTEFYLRNKEKGYTESYCKSCSHLRTSKKNSSKFTNKDNLEAYRKYKRDKERQNRVEGGQYLIRFILADCKSSDRRKGRNNDLTREFVAGLVDKPCEYCGDTEGRMSLDRIDNDLGHIQANVVRSCTRCNLVRGQMPYEAWIVVARGMREARLAGLFGKWDGNIRKKC